MTVSQGQRGKKRKPKRKIRLADLDPGDYPDIGERNAEEEWGVVLQPDGLR